MKGIRNALTDFVGSVIKELFGDLVYRCSTQVHVPLYKHTCMLFR